MSETPIAEFGAEPSTARAVRDVAGYAPSDQLGVTTLDALRDIASDHIDTEPIEINVPKRPGVSVRYSVDLDAPRFQSWQRACKDRSSPTGLDDLRLSLTVLASQCVGIVVNDQLVLDDTGQPATFRSDGVMQMFGGRDANQTARKVYANDGHLLATAQEVIRECGYGEEVAANAANPT